MMNGYPARQKQAAWTVVLAATAWFVGCGGGAEQVKPTGLEGARQERARFGNLETEARQVETFDLDGDSKADQWKIASGGRVIRIERDLNFDGRPDVFRYPNSSGSIVEEEMDLDVDGVVDVVNYYRSEQLIRKELSVDFSGSLSIVKFYVDGKLDRVERDSSGDGKVDTWEYYEDDKLQRTGRDLDNDGKPDVFDEVKS